MPGRSEYYRTMIEYRIARKQEIRDRLIAAAEAQSDPKLLWNDLEAEQDRLLEMEKNRRMIQQDVLSGRKSQADSMSDAFRDAVKPQTFSGGSGRRSSTTDVDAMHRRLTGQHTKAIDDLAEAAAGLEGTTLKESDIRDAINNAWNEHYKVEYETTKPGTIERAVVQRNFAEALEASNIGAAALWEEGEEFPNHYVSQLTGEDPSTFSRTTVHALNVPTSGGSYRVARSPYSQQQAAGLAATAGDQYGYLDQADADIARADAQITAQQERIADLRQQIRTNKPADIDLADIERQAAIEYTEAYGTPRGKRLLDRERQRIGREDEFAALPEDVRSEIEDDPRLARAQRRLERSGMDAVADGRMSDLEAAKAPQMDAGPQGPALGQDSGVLQSLSQAKAGRQESPIQIVSGDQFRTIDGQSKPASEITGQDLAKWALVQSLGANPNAQVDDMELDAARELTSYVNAVRTDSPDAPLLMTRLGEYISADAVPTPSQMLQGLRDATDATGQAAASIRRRPGISETLIRSDLGQEAVAQRGEEVAQRAATADAPPLVFEDPLMITGSGGILDEDEWLKQLEQLSDAPAPQQAMAKHKMARDRGGQIASFRWYEGQEGSPLNDKDVVDKVLEYVQKPKAKASIKRHSEQVAEMARLAPNAVAQDYTPQLRNIFEEEWDDPDVQSAAITLYEAFAELAKANP